MAVVDLSILSNLSIIFVFLVSFVGGWGLFRLVDPFKQGADGSKLYALMAFGLSIITIASPTLLAVFRFVLPWFSLLVLVIFFMIFAAGVLSPGFEQKELSKNPTVQGFLIFFSVLIVVFGLANAFGQDLLEEQPGITDADRIQGDFRPVDEFVPAGEFNSGSGDSFNRTAIPTSAASEDDFASNIVLTIFHPKILGMVFMLVLAAMTMLLIAR